MQEKVDFGTTNILSNYKAQLREGLELNSDYNLPDYINDIRKLDRFEAKAELHNIFNNGNSVHCEGEVIYNILVICEDESIKNIIYSEDFTVTAPSKENMGSEQDLFCRITSPQVRLTTQRRINCRSRINIYERCYDTVSSDIETNSIDTADNIERLTDTLKAVTEQTHYEYDLHSSHDIELSSNTPEINNIIYCRVNSYISEVKHIESQLALRGETRVEILYESDDREYHYLSRNLPYSELIESRYEAICPCIFKINIKDIKVSAQNNSFGEMRIFELDYSYDIEEIFLVTNDFELTKDAYCINNLSEISVDKFEYKQYAESFFTPIRLDEIKEIPDYDEYIPRRVVDAFCEIRGCELSHDSENNKYSVNGEYELRIICECGEGENRSLYNISYSLPIKFERDSSVSLGAFSYIHDINISDCQCSIEGGKIHITGELIFNCIISENKESAKVYELHTVNEEMNKRAPITLYYPKNDDTVWDIAKKYRCRCKDIINANSLKGDDLSDIKVLLIPTI